MLISARRISSSTRRVPDRRSLRSLGSGGAAALLLATIFALPSFAQADGVSASCDRVAAPSGSDSAAGTVAAPLRTAQALANALAPGQVGCLRAGSYGGGLRVNHGGNAGAPLTLRSYPGEQAQITGRFYIPRGSDYVTIADLHLNGNLQSGQPLPSPSINANHATFEGDDVTNEHTEICFDIGSETWGAADSTVLAGNRIHDCGVLPSTNEDHGIYLQDATNTHIVGNLIDHNADRGIQFYPSAQGSVVTGNVIAANGEGLDFSGDYGVASNGNVVEHNLIVGSTIRHDVESWYPAGNPIGVGNVVQNNCLSTRGVSTLGGGFTARANVTASSAELLGGEGGNYQPAPGSTCAAVVAGLSTPSTEGARSGGAPNPKEVAVGTTPAAGSDTVTGSGQGVLGGAAQQQPTHGHAAQHRRRARSAKRADAKLHKHAHAVRKRSRALRSKASK